MATTVTPFIFVLVTTWSGFALAQQSQVITESGKMNFYTKTTSTAFTGTDVKMSVDSSTGNVGVGTTSPASKLDVQGEVKFGNTSSTCNATNEGQQRYNSTLKVMEYCDASAWRSIAPLFTTISASIYSNNNETAWTYSAYVSCPAGYTLQFFGLRGHNAGTSSNYHYCDCSSSGNSIRAGVYGMNNSNYSCTCGGLCTK